MGRIRGRQFFVAGDVDRSVGVEVQSAATAGKGQQPFDDQPEGHHHHDQRDGARLTIEIGVIHVVESKAYHFEKLAKGKSAELSAPPFAFEVESEANEVMVVCSLVRDKKLTSIRDMRDESDRDGLRVVIELKRDATPDVVLNQLYRFTALQKSVTAKSNDNN